MQRAGLVKSVWRYPFKSMQGEELARADVRFSGVHGDRIYALVDPEAKKASFPWFSAREAADLLLFRPRFRHEPSDPYPPPQAFALDVATPDAKTFNAGDPAFVAYLQTRYGKALAVRFSESNMVDSRPVSLMGLATIRQLGSETGLTLDPRRFRANFYVAWDEGGAFYEDTLVGRQIAIGERLKLLIVKRDPRCVIITMDPDTSLAEPRVLQNVGRAHRGCAGVYAVVVQEGQVVAEDQVYLLD